MISLRQKKLFLFDMDGTIYLGNNLFDGTLDLLNFIKNSGGKYMFLTNNSSKSVDSYIKKLANMGIYTCQDDFSTSSQATCSYLKKHNKNDLIYVLGTNSLKEELIANGLNITDKLQDNIKCLVMGFDTELTFHKLEDACKLLGRGVDYIATNPDWVCPTEYGYVPDCGSVSEMLFNATKRRPKFIGKPNPTMIELAMDRFNYTKDETVLLGDRLYTDIASGQNAGIDTIFVLSGESTIDDLKNSNFKPTYIYNNVKDIYIHLKNN